MKQESPIVLRALVASERLSDWIEDRHPTQFGFTRSNLVAATLYAAALDHRANVLLLAEHNARSSAYALARCVYEAYLRGMWYQYAASPADLVDLLVHRKAPKFSGVLKGLRKHKVSDALLDAEPESTWPFLSDFSHGGPLQIMSWFEPPSDKTVGGVGSVHPEGELASLLAMCDVCAFGATQRMCEIAGHPIDDFGERRTKLLAEIDSRKDDFREPAD